MTDLSGRAIALTGAGSGIGRALAQLLAAKGVRLALADKDAAGLNETKALLGNAPATATVLDVTDTAALDRVDRRGGARIQRLGRHHQQRRAVGRRALRRLSGGRFRPGDGRQLRRRRRRLPRRSAPPAPGRDAAWIVNISSVFGMMGYPTQSAYNASKFAVRGLTEALYLELGADRSAHPRDPRPSRAGSRPTSRATPNSSRGCPAATARSTRATSSRRTRGRPRSRPPRRSSPAWRRGRHRVLIGPDAKMIDWITRLFPVTYYKRIGAFLGGR